MSVRALEAGDVPVIDLAPLRDGGDYGTVAAALEWAASEVGFIYVKNHGIPDAVLSRARAAGFDFFRSPSSRKQTVASNAHHHGYLGPGATKMTDRGRTDLKESYNFGLEVDEPALREAADRRFLGPNEWPDDFAPGFRAAVYPFFEHASACAERLLRGFAVAAGQSPDLFLRTSNLPVSRGSLQYYPPRPADAADDHYSLAAHTDFGVLTVLAQDEVGGLEIQTAAGEWVAAPPLPGTLVVNVGDLLGRWSNDRFRSTPHRVMNTSGRERLSLVLAYDPNAETLIDASALCAGDEAPRYEPITCGDYLTWRFGKAFGYRQSQAPAS